MNKKKIDSIVSLLEKSYQDLLHPLLENIFISIHTSSFSYSLYSFLNDYPTASDEEYGKYYNDLYKRNCSFANPAIVKSLNFVLNIRKVIDKYKPKMFTIEVKETLFNYFKIKLPKKELSLELIPSITYHELYKIITKSFELSNIPFHLRRITNNQLNRAIEVEVFDDDIKLFQLNSFNFTIYYGIPLHSTKSYIKSMIVQKIIPIADDLIIKARSKDANFQVKYDTNHKGWFNVPFNIEWMFF